MAALLVLAGCHSSSGQIRAAYEKSREYAEIPNFSESVFNEDSITEYCYALITSSIAGNQTAEQAKWLMDRQLADGGFAFFGEAGDVDVTAIAVIALTAAGYKDSESVENAVSFLEAAQTDAGYIAPWSESGKPNSCSAAAALSAFVAVGDMKSAESLAYHLLKYQLSDGTFAYELGDTESNVFATPQAALALGDFVNESCSLLGDMK